MRLANANWQLTQIQDDFSALPNGGSVIVKPLARYLMKLSYAPYR
jgi:hypothetical protein